MNSKKKFFLFMSFLFACLFIAFFSGYLGLNQNSLEAFLSVNHTLSAVLYNVLFIVLTSFSFSVSVMTSIGALIFPWYEAVAYAIMGIMGSSIIDFYISRKLGRNYIRNYIEKRGGKIERFDRIVEKNPFKTTLILSAIFFVPPTIPNFLGGIIKINLRDYSIATFLGNIPNTFFTVILIVGLFHSNNFQIYGSLIGLVLTTLIAMFFYTGEIKDILVISFPWIFREKKN